MKLTITLAQQDFTVGAVSDNCDKIIQQAKAQADAADVIVFPELALSGYPPEDLLLREDFIERIELALEKLQAANLPIAIVVGHPWKEHSCLFNAASVIENGQLVARYYKQELPNYSVFDEKRYFSAGEQACVFDVKGIKLGLVICEDLWHPTPVSLAKQQGAEIIISPNASPYHQEKHAERLGVASQRATEQRLPVVYVNHICGQDELVFDGHSFVVNAQGELTHELDMFDEQCLSVVFENGQPQGTRALPEHPVEQELYQALVLGVRDYINKNGFKGAVLGLSGGIDSALTLAVAADAIGADKVHAVMMPFKYTSEMSIQDAAEQANVMGVKYDVVPIEPMFDAFMGQLDPLFADTQVDTTEENLQARSRGVLLMALSNKYGKILLTTGNKSEMAVGYCTLYGDMCGGFAVIKDLPKMMVYRLSEYRNTLGQVIPQRVIDRPPSAELAPDQVDQDSLPPYDELDDILACYIEDDMSWQEIVDRGYQQDVVKRVLRLVDLNEYKRRQAAIGPKVTTRNFGKDRRYPITSGFGRETR